jgi:peptide/nickel transport system permease protein
VEKSSNAHSIDAQSPAAIAWRRFRHNPPAMGGLIFILLILLVSAIGPFIRPDSTVNANDQALELSRQKPGFEVSELRVVSTTETSGIWKTWVDGGQTKSFTSIYVDSIRHDNKHVIAYRFGKSALFADTLDPQTLMRSPEGNIVFTRTFSLGTDKYGRDLLSRLMAGSSISLAVGSIAVLISLLVGLTLGLIAGYYRGRTDAIIMWFTNVVWAVPTLILVMAITFAFGTGFWKVFLAVGLTMWVEVARIARGQVLSIREKEYVEAARALGYSEFRIIFKHILPNILSPIIVISAANFASAILIEAGLSFLGLGAQIPTPSWGNMIREHYAYITTDLAYLAIVPGFMIMLLVLAFMMVGNGLRDALDVRE